MITRIYFNKIKYMFNQSGTTIIDKETWYFCNSVTIHGANQIYLLSILFSIQKLLGRYSTKKILIYRCAATNTSTCQFGHPTFIPTHFVYSLTTNFVLGIYMCKFKLVFEEVIILRGINMCRNFQVNIWPMQFDIRATEAYRSRN